ncbi:MAG: hypothetical protein KDE51_12295, partial [Anaerolineales bacterium]|nr:hypothetical protein [Anaerolineales bacterium]
MLILSSCVNAPAAEEAAPSKPLNLTPPSAEAFLNLEQLQAVRVPARDLVDLTERYKGGPVPRTVTRTAATVGTTVPFWISDDDA